VSQKAKNLDSFVVHKGLLTQMLLYHGEAASIDAALKSMGVVVDMRERE
jgi:kynureninase